MLSLDVNTLYYLFNVVLMCSLLLSDLIIACLWTDHPCVCKVRIFSIGKCFESLELDKAGLDNCMSGHGVQRFNF